MITYAQRNLMGRGGGLILKHPPQGPNSDLPSSLTAFIAPPKIPATEAAERMHPSRERDEFRDPLGAAAAAAAQVSG